MKATLLLLSLLLHGSPGEPDTESLSAPPRADESPTALACTVESLRRGQECTFESEPEPTGGGPEQAASNVRTVQGLGRALCAQAARAGGSGAVDVLLAAVCERRFATAAEQCALGGSVVVVDGKGRFAPQARECYLGLEAVLQEVESLAATASACCQCGARSGCLAASERCYTEVSRQELAAGARACLAERCRQSCPLVEPEPPAAARPLLPQRSQPQEL